jgi:hypothetical protein
MPQTIITDDEGEPCIERPVRKPKPTAALLLSAESGIPFQKRAVNEFRVAEAAKCAAEHQKAIDDLYINPQTTTSSSQDISISSASSLPGSPVLSVTHTINKKRAYVEDDDCSTTFGSM